MFECSRSEDVRVDESMNRLKGRSLLKHFNFMKSVKLGCKLWCVAESSGYVYKFEVHDWKNYSEKNSAKNLG